MLAPTHISVMYHHGDMHLSSNTVKIRFQAICCIYTDALGLAWGAATVPVKQNMIGVFPCSVSLAM